MVYLTLRSRQTVFFPVCLSKGILTKLRLSGAYIFEGDSLLVLDSNGSFRLFESDPPLTRMGASSKYGCHIVAKF